MRWAVVLVVVAACGRIDFDPLHDGGANGDGSVATPRCTVPARPDVSNPRITLGCDQIIAVQEVLNGGVIRFDCPTSVLLGSPILVNQDTIIDGHDVVFDGQGITRIFLVNNNAHLTLLDVTVTRGAVNNDGGSGISVDSGGLATFDSTFTENHGAPAGQSGGAIRGRAASTAVEVYGGRFSNNSCASGGGVYSYSDLTIVSSAFDNNVALGTGGDLGNGGDGGAVQFAGAGGVTLCGDTFTANVAGHNGGAIAAISTTQINSATLTDLAIDFNRGEGAGGAYLQAFSTMTMSRVSVQNNAATTAAGGLWLEGPSTFHGENVSIVANRADAGVGAGMFVGSTAGAIAVRFSFSTIADNLGNCVACGASGIANALDLDLANTIIVDNTSQGSQMACSQTGPSGVTTWQWPGDPPPCVPNVTVADPLLLPRANATGPVGTLLVRRPSSGSPVIGVAATGCPAEDILGNPRPTPCSAGSVEP